MKDSNVDISSSEWAERVKQEVPYCCDEALTLGRKWAKVRIEFRDDHSYSGDYVWAIVTGDDFWLDTAPSYEHVVSLCKEMGWEITNYAAENDRKTI